MRGDGSRRRPRRRSWPSIARRPTRLSRRLGELGVRHERLDLMKPVLLRLERKVDPEELFPWREFPLR